LFSLGSFWQITNSALNFGLHYSTEKNVELYRKNGLGYILGDFFTNTSVHRGRATPVPKIDVSVINYLHPRVRALKERTNFLLLAPRENWTYLLYIHMESYSSLAWSSDVDTVDIKFKAVYSNSYYN
jgi:hypothetical protein